MIRNSIVEYGKIAVGQIARTAVFLLVAVCISENGCFSKIIYKKFVFFSILL